MVLILKVVFNFILDEVVVAVVTGLILLQYYEYQTLLYFFDFGWINSKYHLSYDFSSLWSSKLKFKVEIRDNMTSCT